MVPSLVTCGSVSRRGIWMIIPELTTNYGEMSMQTPQEIRVCMDIGSKCHRVAMGLSDGKLLEEFDVPHTSPGIENFFAKLASYEKQYQLPLSIAMEAYNGHARPIDQYALAKGYRVLNVNNNKLAQFKKIFPGAAKSDAIDTRKMFELFTLSEHLPIAKNVLQEIHSAPEVNNKLKRLTRRRASLVQEKVSTANRMYSDLQAVSPGLLTMTKQIDNKWFLTFITARDDLRQLKGMREKSLIALKSVGETYLADIKTWQKTAEFSGEVEWVGEMIIQDAQRILALKDEIKKLEKHMKTLIPESAIANRIQTINGFGFISAAALAGEIGVLERFPSEASLALYVGMAVLDNSSGTYMGSKQWIHVNRYCKNAMMVGVAAHVRCCPESKKYYDRKRSEGKRHNQAVRCLGRHMVRVIWSMLKNERDYELRNSES